MIQETEIHLLCFSIIISLLNVSIPKIMIDQNSQRLPNQCSNCVWFPHFPHISNKIISPFGLKFPTRYRTFEWVLSKSNNSFDSTY